MTDAFRDTRSARFAQTLAAGGQVKAIIVPGCAGYTRREIDELTEVATRAGARGLATFAIEPMAFALRSPSS